MSLTNPSLHSVAGLLPGRLRYQRQRDQTRFDDHRQKPPGGNVSWPVVALDADQTLPRGVPSVGFQCLFCRGSASSPERERVRGFGAFVESGGGEFDHRNHGGRSAWRKSYEADRSCSSRRPGLRLIPAWNGAMIADPMHAHERQRLAACVRSQCERRPARQAALLASGQLLLDVRSLQAPNSFSAPTTRYSSYPNFRRRNSVSSAWCASGPELPPVIRGRGHPAYRGHLNANSCSGNRNANSARCREGLPRTSEDISPAVREAAARLCGKPIRRRRIA